MTIHLFDRRTKLTLKIERVRGAFLRNGGVHVDSIDPHQDGSPRSHFYPSHELSGCLLSKEEIEANFPREPADG